MRITLSSLAAAATLLIAGTAQAQSRDALEYRVLAAGDDSAALASVIVTGPQDARRMTNIMMAAEAGASGADNFVSDVTVNCPAGSINYSKSAVYAGDELMSDLPDSGEWRVPRPQSMDSAMVDYACRGTLINGETSKVRGLSAARAEGRLAMKH